MYGSLKHAADAEGPFSLEEAMHSFQIEHKSDTSEETPLLGWELIMLLSSEFLIFALILTPFLPDSDSQGAIASFWTENPFVSLGTFAVFLLITIPVSAGYTWFILRWPFNMLVWAFVVLSVGATVHICSVFTDPKAVFVEAIAISAMLLVFSFSRMIGMIRFTGVAPWVLAAGSLVIVFMPMALGDLLTSPSVYAAPAAAAVCAVFIIAEFRLIERGATFALISSKNDPFTLSVWVNCGIWRFLVQLASLLLKLALHASIWLLSSGWRTVKWCVASLFSLVPRRWWTPWQTVDRLSQVT